MRSYLDTISLSALMSEVRELMPTMTVFIDLNKGPVTRSWGWKRA